MNWKLRPSEPIKNYTSTMKFYKVEELSAGWDKLSVLSHRKYKKWAWETCGSTWAITPPTKRWNPNGCSVYFYIGFEAGEDKMGFRLAHDPIPLAIIEQHLKVFVREKVDK